MTRTRWPLLLLLTLLLQFQSACGGAAPRATTAPGPGEIEARPLAAGETGGELTPADAQLDRGQHVHGYALTLDPSRRIRIRMTSEEVDPVLELTGPGGLHLYNDDAVPGTSDAMLDFLPPVAGRYEVLATTSAGGETGRYTLVLETRAPGGLGAPLVLGETAAGDLSEHREDGVPGSWLHFEGAAGSLVRLRVTSADFDTVATVIGPNGQTWVNDDAYDRGDGTERALDSTLVIALDRPAVYQLVVSSYDGAEAGAFRVATSVRPPVVVADGEAAPPGGFAGPRAEGRVLGLFAGISAYVEHSELYGCADDASFLARAMREAHLQRPDEQVVLTDGAATREGFMAGLTQLASNARPEDVVLVFFSGHGEVQPVPEGDTSELDGLDETIELYDGGLTDTEVSAALDAVQAATLVLAIDACHSGGFADDFVTRPGRIGIFSSDEDVLSATAEPRRAGGYLSYHLRRAVLGEADRRPRDGVLTAGELTDHIYDGFVADHGSMSPAQSMDPLQRLVVRRGSIRWSDVLWVHPRRPDLTLPEVPSLPLQSPPP